MKTRRWYIHLFNQNNPGWTLDFIIPHKEEDDPCTCSIIGPFEKLKDAVSAWSMLGRQAKLKTKNSNSKSVHVLFDYIHA